MNIYVENLDFSVDTVDLTMHFAQFGLVTEVKLVTDKFSGRSKGFAFIEMPNDDEAQKAIEESQGIDMNGKSMVISEAKPQAPRRPDSRGGGGFNRGGGGGFNRGGGGGGFNRGGGGGGGYNRGGDGGGGGGYNRW
ncbi:RNA-binding protein [uncultured Chitinophaga sp.]|uniref:RNA recognition motif domain-containing protein n=1 Tax=uncultured Chitinophaga sp. TaxID=339340 RepID=UPI0025E0AF2F|nr:RNA-binding protein [uncultured Chitinophaga sp.]